MEGPNENEQDNKIGQYKVKDKIGEGSFGQIYEVEKEGKIYAIKTENLGNIKPMIALEYQIFKQLQQNSNSSSYILRVDQRGFGFPKVYEYCQKDHFSYMVMDRLSMTLQDLANVELQNKIDKDVLILIMYNTLKCLQAIHQTGYVYRDVKPSNFMLKRSELQKNEAKIYLIDLGLSKRYLKKGSNEHIPLKNNKKMIGTAIFCSLNVHKGLQGSRRDDLQSWVYMMIYLVQKLPWQIHSVHSLPSASQTETSDHKESIYQKIGKLKQETNINLMIKQEDRLPINLIKIMDYIKHLQFETKPNYDMIYRLLQQEYDQLTKEKISLNDIAFRAKTIMVPKQKQAKKPKIKINFKIPEHKIKQKRRVSIDKIALTEILQK